MNIWDIAITASQCANENPSQGSDSSILFLGNKGSGKSTIINRFLDRDEPAKPTVALEYTFGRRPRAHNSMKDVTHLWELGGGIQLIKLIDNVITPETILSLSIVLVIDLTKPSEMWSMIETVISSINKRLAILFESDEVQTKKDSSSTLLRQQLKDRMQLSLKEHHERDLVEPFLLPLTFIASKYDSFIDTIDPKERKTILKTLRFLAHYHCASLQCFTVKQEMLLNRARTLISNLAFGTPAPQTFQIEHTKPLLVPAGFDSFKTIGNAPSDDERSHANARSPIELWKQSYCHIYPQAELSKKNTLKSEVNENQFAESIVDNMARQKDEELDRYKKISNRKMRDLMQQAINEGILIV